MPGNLELALRIRADLTQAQQRLRALEADLKRTGTAAGGAGRASRTAARDVDRIAASAEQGARGLSRMDVAIGAFAANLAAGALTRGVAVLAQIPGALIESGLAAERLESRFRFAAGSIAAGARELAFVRAEANRLGIDFRGAADAYSGLAAAARGTALSTADTREIFLGVAESARVMGLDAEQTRGALLALEQILSKGKVSAEELRGQLGERLPGAFQIAARAMGVTTAELDRMLAAGELLSEDFLPRFAQALRENVAAELPSAVDRAAASFARLGNAVDAVSAQVARSGFIEFLAESAERVADLIEQVRRLQAVDGILPEEFATLDVDGLRAQLAAVEAAIEQARENLAASGTVFGEELFARQIAQLTAQAEALRGLLAEAAPPIGVDRAPAAPTPVAPTPAAAAPGAAPGASRGADALAQIEARLRDREAAAAGALARLVRAEETALAEIDALQGQAGVDEAARLETRAATVEFYAARRRELQRAELEAAHAAALEEAGAIEATRQAVIAGLAEGADALATPYERSIAAIDAWEARTRAAIDAWSSGTAEAEAAVTELAETSAERRARAAEEEAERRLRAATDAASGATRALQEYAAAAADTGTQVERATSNALRGMEDALVEFTRTGKLSFSGLVDSILADLARIAARQAILGAIGLGGDLFGGELITGSVGHGGGIAGALRRRRIVDARVFAGAPRLHRGGIAGALAPGEVPTILRQGEGVFTPEQMRALGGPQSIELVVEVENRGTPQVVTPERAFTDADNRHVVRLVANDMAAGGDVARSTSARFGLSAPGR